MDHLDVAEYHRKQARLESNRQGSSEIRLGDTGAYYDSRSREISHQNAAFAAEEAHAAQTGQTVSWDPCMNPHFSRK